MENIEGVMIEFTDSLGNRIQIASLGYIHYSKKRDVKEAEGKANLNPIISLRKHNSLLAITVPIRRTVKRERNEGIVGYRFPPGRCNIRITASIGENTQELLIPLIIK